MCDTWENRGLRLKGAWQSSLEKTRLRRFTCNDIFYRWIRV